MFKNYNTYKSANIKGCEIEFFKFYLLFLGELFCFAVSILLHIVLIIPVLHKLMSSLK